MRGITSGLKNEPCNKTTGYEYSLADEICLSVCGANSEVDVTFLRRCGVLLIVFGLSVLAALAMAQSSEPFADQFEGLEYDQLKQILKDAKVYRTLGSSKRAIDAPKRCGQNREEVQKSRQKFDQYKALNDANPTAQNKREAEKWQTAIDREIKHYKDCFANNLPDFGVIWTEGITTYDLHRAKYREMRDDFGRDTNMNWYIFKLEDRIATWGDEFSSGMHGEKREVGEGKIAAISGQVEFRSYANASSWSSWVPARTGRQLKDGNSIRTGPGSSVKIVLSTTNQKKIKKVELVLGPNTEINIRDLIRGERWSAENPGVVSLIRGTLRTVVRGFSLEPYRVRMGGSLCGIRGTEVAINYDPATDVADIVLDHGDAYYKTSGGPEVTLLPRTGVKITRGRASAARHISASEWQGLVEKTAPPFGLEAPLEVPLEPVPKKPDPNNLSDPAWKELNFRINASYASEMVKGLLHGLNDADPANVYKFSAGDYHTTLNARKAKTGDLRTFLQASKQRPLEFDVGCTICKTEDECWTWADLTTLSSPVDKLRVVFVTQKVGSNKRVVTSKAWNTETQTAFNNTGSQFCE